jgi:hypothetical protein
MYHSHVTYRHKEFQWKKYANWKYVAFRVSFATSTKRNEISHMFMSARAQEIRAHEAVVLSISREHGNDN